MQEKEWKSICEKNIEDWNKAFNANLKFVVREHNIITWIILSNGEDYIGTCKSWFEMYLMLTNIRAGMEIMFNHYSCTGAV